MRQPTAPDPALQAAPASREQDVHLEREKLRLERTKTWLTAVSIVVPVLASLGTFVITRQQSLDQARIEQEIKYSEREINSKIEFLKLITQSPQLRDEAIRNWQQVFPADVWLKDVTSSGTKQSK